MIGRYQAVRETRELWALLSESGDESKDDAAVQLGMSDYRCSCPCCEYSFDKTEQGTDPCIICPVKWTDLNEGSTPCLEADSPFIQWEDADSQEDRKKYALAITLLKRKPLK